jgi:hypothetical protein
MRYGARWWTLGLLVVPLTVAGQSSETVTFVNATPRNLAVQVDGSPMPVGGGRSLVIRPGESGDLRVTVGRQRLRTTMIQLPLGGGVLGPRVGPVFERWLDVEPGLVVRVSEQGAHVQRARPAPDPSLRGQVAYAGHSAQFAPIKARLLRGEGDSIQRQYREKEQKAWESCDGKARCYVVRAGFLGLVEKGTLALDVGAFDQSITDFQAAELFLQVAQDEGKVSEWLKKGFNFFVETLTGHEEFSTYFGEGFERVLVLNYKTIAHMLQGDRRAYNVTRRAIDWQNMERIRFEEKLREEEEELREKDQGARALAQVRAAYRETDARASSVASAYVNPFGYYMAGVIQELESRLDPSLRGNALISYRKALDLNPGSPVIQQAVRELENQGVGSEPGRLVHVVVNDGFVPEKMVLTQHFSAGANRSANCPVVVPIKLPYYRPVPNRVQRIALETPEGHRLADLHPVADVEAIVLRHQKALQAFLTVRIVLAGLRSAFAAALKCHENPFARLLGGLMTTVSAPDTRAWMTLPATIQAARIHLPPETRRVMITTYDAQGGKLASQTVEVAETGATFVYGRSLDNRLIVRESAELWVNRLNPGERVVSQ